MKGNYISQVKHQIVAFVVILVTLISCMPQEISAHETHENEIKVISSYVIGETGYIQYFLTIDGKRKLCTEELKINNGEYRLYCSRVEIDHDKKEIKNTRERESIVYQIPQIKVEKNPIQSLARSAGCRWKNHTERFSLIGAKLYIFSVATILGIVAGIAMPESIGIASFIVSTLLQEGKQIVPSYIFFKGQRCVSRTVGKIYYRYRGGLYWDSNHQRPIRENLSWSRRWNRAGHA
nr:hypothetical protein [Shuttleworthia satelles]